jgi:hypothetical protein
MRILLYICRMNVPWINLISENRNRMRDGVARDCLEAEGLVLDYSAMRWLERRNMPIE